MQAAFASVDITPAPGSLKIGWIVEKRGLEVLDPLYARALVLEQDGVRVAILQLDTLCVRWQTVEEIRRQVQRRWGIAPSHLLVAATHNHAGPAVRNCGEVPRDDAYLEGILLPHAVDAVGQAVGRLTEAGGTVHQTFVFDVAHNRRVVMRDGTVRTHGHFDDPDALCLEGPIDPELAVLAFRTPAGEPLGCVLNFACHPTHHGADGYFSAGFPGAVAAALDAQGFGTTLYLNGASGNVHFTNPCTRESPPMEEVASRLIAHARRALAGPNVPLEPTLAGRTRTIQIPFRTPTEEEIAGRVRGAQRFVDPASYDRAMPALLADIDARRTQPAEVQVLSIGQVDLVGVPAEAFVELGLRIKERLYPRHALVVGHANGMVGYVPTLAAFARGGYETTFGAVSRLAPEAGDLLVEAVFP